MFLATVALLICGIIATYSTPKLLFHVHKHEGWLIYLNSAKIGVYCLIIGFIFSEIIFPAATSLVYAAYSIFSLDLSFKKAWENTFTLPKPASFFEFIETSLVVPFYGKIGSENSSLFIRTTSAAVGTLLLTIIFRHVHDKFSFNFVNATNEAAEVFSSKSYIDDLLLEASVNIEYILVTVEEGKCYVGIIDEIPLAIQENGVGVEAIRLFIVKSGHRCHKDRTFVIDHDYDEVWLSIKNSISENIANIEEQGITYENYPEVETEVVEPIISIPRGRILSVSKYDPEYYHSFNGGIEIADK
ncbi:hypothetical protein [Halomonas sp. M4R1S46]|uniref:hypothetical protein n=1 Tax=Halomonas sp. M4R1S46 TaxID=2982692 RepID=UPI0021E47054|nr:hypothetical protein [Halomonas sp. M4R1S46]UYG07283.1 hypothetical protein OCT48_16870 [Halomonas sp. M4R1S46]